MDTNKMFIDMAQRAREFAEMCDRVANESNAVKEDPEAWRERNRQRQAAGVKFEWRNEGIWRQGYKGSIFTFDIGGEEDYREVPHEPRPAKLTAKICRREYWAESKEHDYEFYGTPDEYRAECEKYGYLVISDITEVVEKPKTVKRYMAMLKYKTDPPFSCVMDSCHTITLYATRKGYNIIGNIEEREVPIE